MRRIVLALIGSVFGITVLVGLKAVPTANLLGWSAEAGLAPDEPGAAGAGEGPGSSAAAGGGATPGASVGPSQSGAAPGPSASAPTTPGGGGGTTTAAPPPAASQTFTGTAVFVPTAQSPTTLSASCRDCASYSISVTITVTGGKITKATASYSPSPGGSLSYANSANSKLSQSILTAQKWNLGRVSAATYSGNAWELSVKDAMTKAGLPV